MFDVVLDNALDGTFFSTIEIYIKMYKKVHLR